MSVDAEVLQQVPRVLKQSTAPVRMVPKNSLSTPNLAKEFGLEIPMGTGEQELKVWLTRLQHQLINAGHSILFPSIDGTFAFTPNATRA